MIEHPGHKAIRAAIETAAEIDDPQPWHSSKELIIGSKGQVISNLANLMLALRQDPAWRGVLGFDEMAGVVMAHKPPPALPGMMPPPNGPYPRPWDNHDDRQAQEWLQKTAFHRVGKEVVSDAVSQRARELSYHPVRDWLARIQHDGVPRIEGGTSKEGDLVAPWLTHHLGVEDTPYSREVGRVWLLGMVARVVRPGCKVDTVPILEGPQGAGKSTVCAILGDRWFTDSLPPIDSKDAEQHLAGKWLVELSELEAMNKPNAIALKAFISRQAGKFRPPYERREIDQPRQCLFVGTTNEDAYLKDPSGGRRFLPVRVGQIDLDGLKAERDQLFAEAFARIKSGEPWHTTDPALLAAAQEEQVSRYDNDPWEEEISRALAGRSFVTIGEVMRHTLGIEKPKLARADQNRVRAILTNLGWWKSPTRLNGNYPWYPPGRSDEG